MKFLDILESASSNMLRSKIRSILTIIAIFVGAFTITLTVGISSGISSYIDEQVGNMGAEDMLIVQGKTDNPFESGPQKYEEDVTTSNAGGFPMVVLDAEDVEKVRSQAGILSADLDYNVAPNYVSGPQGDKYKVMAGAFYSGINVTLAAGKVPDNSAADNQVLLTLDYLPVLGFESSQDAVDETIVFGIKNPSGQQKEVKAVVAGVQEQSLISTGGVMLNRSLIQELHGLQTEGLPQELKEQQPIVTARFDPSISEEEIETIKSGLDEKGYTATTIKDQIGIFKQVIDAITAVLVFFGAIALLAASFGIINTLFMAVQERTKEIGLMKAVGMSRNKIFTLFSVEAILLGFWGSLLGVLAAMGIGSVINRAATNSFLKDLHGFDLTSFPVRSTALIVLLVMGIAFLAGTLPARRAAKQDPIDALRYE